MKSMKKALSLFLALSMLMTVCAVNILAEDTVTLTVPNGNFANTCDANGTMPDGWTPKLVAATAFASNRQYTISSAFANSDAEGAPSSDGSYSLELLDTSTGGLLAESPKISLGSALTEKKEFSLTFDHKSGNGAQYIGAAVNFYNADGKIYNGGEWIDELTSETMTEMTSWQLKDADGKDSFIYINPSSVWTNTSVSAVAPIGTASVSASFVAATGGALRVYYDNVAISYKSIASAAGLQPVTNLTASAGDGQVTLSWGLPTDATNYAGVKIAVKNGTTPVKEVFVEDAQKTSEIVTQLENGVDYTFEVYAMNAGKTEFSEAVSVNATPAAPVAGVVEIPNGDFEKTVDVNGALVDGWSYQLYVNPEDTLQTGMLYYAMNTEAGNGTSASGKNSLVMKCPGKGTYEAGTGIIVMSPVVPLSEELTANTKFTYTFDYKCIAQNFNTAILFYNAEGKVYNGSEWIDFIVEKDADWKLTDTSGQETYMSIGVTSDNKNKWLSSQIMADAPAGTSGVRVLAVATGGGANKFGIDNLNVTYEVQKPEVTAPNPVTNLKAVAGDKQVTLSWDLPEDTANYAGVKITVKSGSSTVTTLYAEGKEATSKIVNGLTNGTPYTFEVQSMNADKSEFADAVSVTATPHEEGQIVTIPVKNAIKDRAMYADDHQLTVDLGIISSNPPTGSDGILYNNIVNATNVFDTDNTKLTFSSDTPGVSFVKTPYRLGLTYSGGYSTWADVQKLQLVYRPDASQAGKQVTIQVKATVAESDQVLAQGTASFKVTVTPVPQDEWKPTGEGRETYLTVPNGNFDRTTTANEFKNNFNKDIPGGWHALLWAAPNPVMGDDRVGYNVINKNATTDAGVDGQGMDIKGGVAETTEGNILIESGRIATPSTAARKYTMGFQYKGGRNSGKPAAAMFFYNADGELYMGNGVWKADATAADMWSSKDAEGNAAYLQYDVVSGFTSAKLERFAPEGTSYVTVAFAATGGTAYRFQVDNVSLMYVDNLAPVINTENPYTKTISLGETVRLNLAETFTDPDGDVMTYTIEGTNGIIENGVFSYTPNKLGSATAAVAATDSYGEKTVLNLTLTVNDAVSSTTVNKDIKPVTKATVNGSVVLKKADGSNVTSLSQLNAGETLKINVSLKNTSELPVTTTLLIVKYDANGVVESVTTKVIVIPSTGGDPDYTTVRDYVVENNSGSVEVMLWDSATNLNSLIDPIRI